MAAPTAVVGGNALVTSQEAGQRQGLHVMLINTSGNVIESFGGTGGTASTDGDTFAAGTSTGTPAMGAYQATPSAVSDGDLAVIGIDEDRNVKVNVVAGGTAGTQYTEGDTDSSITGTALMFEGAANTLVAAPGTAADGLLVNLGSNNDVTVTGTVAVTGVATAANQTTMIGHLDGVEGLLTTIDGDTGALAGAVATIGSTVGLRVFVFDDANTQVTDFSGSGGGGAGTEYTEDAAAATNPVGGALIVVRDDARAGSLTTTDGDNLALRGTNAGELYVKHVDAIPVTDNGGVLTVDGTVAATQSGTWTVQPGNTANTTAWLVTGTGGTFPVTDSSGSLTVDAPVGTPVFVRLSDGSSAISTLPVSLASVPSHAVTNAGTFAVQAAQSGTWNVGTVTTVSAVTAISNALPAGNNNIGDVDVASIAAGSNTIGGVRTIADATAGGQTPYVNLDVDETEDQIKGTAGKLFWIHVINRANAVRYLKFYNATAASVTVGTTTPVLSFPIPTMGDTNGAGFTINFGDSGVAFSTALTVAATTGLANNDTGAPGADEVVLNAGYL